MQFGFFMSSNPSIFGLEENYLFFFLIMSDYLLVSNIICK